ncbi:hypothetical protein SK128_017830, partial [Halocaridina rubra]
MCRWPPAKLDQTKVLAVSPCPSGWLLRLPIIKWFFHFGRPHLQGRPPSKYEDGLLL